MRKRIVFIAIFSIWLILWLVFLIKENKSGQYRMLTYLYTHDYNAKVRYVMGESLYDFLSFCKKVIPAGSTYDFSGIEDLDEVRARYFLWPLRRDSHNSDFLLEHSTDGKFKLIRKNVNS